MTALHLRLLDEPFAVMKLTPPQSFPIWLSQVTLFFIAATEDEYSVMCPERYIPVEIEHQRGYRCLRVDGELAFDEVGVVARVSKPLADAGLSLFVVSTHDRDYVLVHEDDLDTAVKIYRATGMTVE